MATPRFNPNRPIPNDPFYSPLTNALGTAQGPLIIGAGLSIDYATFTLTATGGGGGAVNQVTGSGAGINVAPTTGNVVVTNTGVTALVAGPGITLSGATGSVTICASGGAGTVTCVGAGPGLAGGPINTTGTLCLPTITTITPAAYTNANVTVDAFGRVVAIQNGTVSGGTVTQVTGCCGIVTTPAGGVTTTGSVALSNTGVTAATYNYATITVDAQGRITSASSNTPSSGTVTCVCTGTGLCVVGGGTAFGTSGTIALANTTVTAASYTNASFTVDAQGRLTAASSGVAPLTALTGTAPICVTTGTTPNVSICPSSTTASGAVQLTTALNNPSESLALTARAGCCLQDQINTLLLTPGIELAGTINATTGFVDSVTSVGTGAGYTTGAILPTASSTNVNTYVIVTVPGTFTPPGGVSTTATKGDWFLSSQTSPGVYAWQFLNVGFDAPPATTSSAGVVCLSTNALAQAGTDTTTALTPAAAASAYIPKSVVTGLGVVLTGTTAGTPAALPAGPNGCALIACSACPCGLTWGAAGGIAATPTAAGVVLGLTNATNAALGCNALLNVTGANNVAVGFNAGACLTSGTENVYIGQCAGFPSTTGILNTAIGQGAYGGYQAAPSALTGNTVTAVGHGSLRSVTGIGGQGSVAIGVNAGGAVTTGVCNTFVGCLSGRNVTTGSLNVAIGHCATVASATGSCQLAIGFSATDNWLTGDSTKAIKPGAGIIDCTGSCGNAGQILFSTGSNSICWGTVGAATPTVFGLVKGCTDATNAALGCNALLNNTATCNVAIGNNAGCTNTAGCLNVYVGQNAGCTATGNFNVVVGALALCCGPTTAFSVTAVGSGALRAATGFGGLCTTAIGVNAGCNVTTGTFNTLVGATAGENITTGSCNVIIGNCVNAASATGDCQLAIGFSPTCTWLTGDSNKHIQPGAGIRDCTGALGTAGQILSSTGTAIQWRNGCVQETASCTANVTLVTEITNRGLANGDSLTIYNSNSAVPPVAITLTATALTNSATYPTQATSTVFTLPPQGSVTLILADSATNTWYIESYDTPEQVGTVVVKARMSSGFTLSANAKIPLNTAIFNPQGYFDTTNNRFQPQVAGYYQVNAQILGDATAWMIAQIKKNGAVEIQSEQTSSPNTEAVPLAGIVYLNGSTDYLELWGTSSSSTTLNADPQFTYFTASLINQTNTRVVGIDAVARMEVSAGNIPSNNAAIEVVPGVNGVSLVTNTEWNPQGWFNTTTGRFTPTIPGYYQVDAYATSNNSNYNSWTGIFKNGTLLGQAIAPLGGGGNWQTSLYSTVVFMNGSTDYLRLGAASQGAVTGFITQTSMSGMSISLVGANQAQPIPPMTWINAGTLQSVGFNAINISTGTPGTAPTITAATQNNIRYRQIGPKEWEVQGVLYFTNGTAGSGDYILTLPGNLQFDLTNPYQLPYTFAPDDTRGWGAYGLIDGWAVFSQTGATSYQQSLIMPYDATRYRIFPFGPSTLFWGSGYYSMGGYNGWRKWGFRFFTP